MNNKDLVVTSYAALPTVIFIWDQGHALKQPKQLKLTTSDCAELVNLSCFGCFVECPWCQKKNTVGRAAYDVTNKPLLLNMMS